MNKKQVKAFLNVMGKGREREILCGALVYELNGKLGLIATDGYILSMIYMETIGDNLEGKWIDRNMIDRWYKLAGAKDILTGADLTEMVSEKYTEREYPKVDEILKSETSPISRISFNAEYLTTIQQINNGIPVELNFNGENGKIIIDNEITYSIIMPIKIK